MLRIGGLIPCSTVDYPGRLSAVLFLQGCAWRCLYCHNPHLQELCSPEELSSEEVWRFLDKRRGLLDAVVLSGGEPLLQSSLLEAVQKLKAMGYQVGLHTSGSHPERLDAVLPHVDWVGLDIKELLEGYDALTQIAGSGLKAWESLHRVLASEVSCEVRTTVHWAIHTSELLWEMACLLKSKGVRSFVIQNYHPREGVLHDLPPGIPPVDWPELRERIEALFPQFQYRA